ncbi:hypothetical protein GCM10009696_06410 [Kocuria himachalensis]
MLPVGVDHVVLIEARVGVAGGHGLPVGVGIGVVPVAVVIQGLLNPVAGVLAARGGGAGVVVVVRGAHDVLLPRKPPRGPR